METIFFNVSVIEYNADKFVEDFFDYIVNQYKDEYDNLILEMEAPQEIYDKVSDLTEEGVDVFGVYREF